MKAAARYRSVTPPENNCTLSSRVSPHTEASGNTGPIVLHHAAEELRQKADLVWDLDAPRQHPKKSKHKVVTLVSAPITWTGHNGVPVVPLATVGFVPVPVNAKVWVSAVDLQKSGNGAAKAPAQPTETKIGVNVTSHAERGIEVAPLSALTAATTVVQKPPKSSEESVRSSAVPCSTNQQVHATH